MKKHVYSNKLELQEDDECRLLDIGKELHYEPTISNRLSTLKLNKAFLYLVTIILTIYSINVYGATSTVSSTIPNTPPSRVVDLARLLTQNEQQTLNTKLRSIYDHTNGVEIQILTIPNLNGEVIEDVALDIGRKWKLGQSGINNGVLILVAAAEHKYRIEIGYGLEGVLPDGYTGRIGRQLLAPNFKTGAYYQGLNLFVDNFVGQINKSGGYTKTKHKPNNASINLIEAIAGAFAFIIICLMLVYIKQKKSRLTNYSSKNHKNNFANILWSIVSGIIISKLFNGSNRKSGSSGSDNNGPPDNIGGGGDFGGGGSSGDY